MRLPNGVGVLISRLKPGDEVIVISGEGYPPTKEDTLTIIAAVDGFSALTVDNIALNCFSVSDLVVTGNHFEKYEITEKAKTTLLEIEARKKEEFDLLSGDSDLSISPSDLDLLD